MGNPKRYLRKLNLVIAVLSLLAGITVDRYLVQSVVFAQTQPLQPNPLEITTPDPLLPKVKRPLSPLERLRVQAAIDGLDAEANGQLNAGNDEVAFELWYRELRLQRVLGPKVKEVEALGRIGAIAWDKERSVDVEWITERLIAIQQKAQVDVGIVDTELLAAFGQAYQQLHKIDKTLEIYQQILANARLQEDIEAQEAALQVIGQQHLARFDYPKAEPVYQELLAIARSQGDSLKQGIYLRELAEIYNESSQPENALRIKQQIINNYIQSQLYQPIAELKISIAADYEALSQPEAASQTYQEAFSLAWSLQQLSVAGDALQKLGDLYRTYNQQDYALQIYRELLKLEQQSYDYYGLMTTYDRIGQIYLAQQNYPQARAAFEKALEIARSLSYQEDYFLTQIEQVNQQMLQ